jgi:serine/threonine protein kinase
MLQPRPLARGAENFNTNVIFLQDVFEDTINIFLVLECASGGDLSCHIATGGKVAKSVVRKISFQLLQGLKFLGSTACNTVIL